MVDNQTNLVNDCIDSALKCEWGERPCCSTDWFWKKYDLHGVRISVEKLYVIVCQPKSKEPENFSDEIEERRNASRFGLDSKCYKREWRENSKNNLKYDIQCVYIDNKKKHNLHILKNHYNLQKVSLESGQGQK